jgi:hypothetical protein
MSVKAGIIIDFDSVYAIPTKAVFFADSNSYVFIKSGNFGFEPFIIKVGKLFQEMTEITSISPEILQKDIVIDGVNFLLTRSKAKK